MVWREINGRYRDEALGLSWIFIRPVVNVLLGTSVMFGAAPQRAIRGRALPASRCSAPGTPGATSDATARLGRAWRQPEPHLQGLHRLIVPLAGPISGLVDMGASLVVFFVALLFVYRMPLHAEMLWLPALILTSMA